jgi:hypothetical protein
MTQPVTRSGWPSDFVGPLPPTTLPHPPGASGVDLLPDPGERALNRLSARAVGSTDPAPDASVVGERLDAFLAAATPTFRTSEGEVTVPIGFFMTSSSRVSGRDEAALGSVLSRAGLAASYGRVTNGRASPDVITKSVQALIDAGYLPPKTDTGSTGLVDRVRQLMFTWGIGLDCAGYVAPATLAARAVRREESGFVRPEDENLSNLGGKGYRRVAPGAPLQTGDVVVLAPDDVNAIGHRAIVRDATSATASEIQTIRDTWRLPESAKGSDVWDKIVVDSSWGNGGVSPDRGGVQRHTWWHDKVTGLWAWSSDVLGHQVTPGPHGHPKFDVFRPRSR